MKIAILTSGGDAPGMNAAIRATARACLYEDIEVYGIRDGYRGLYENGFFKIERHSVSKKLNHGGTFLATARFKELEKDEVAKIVVDNLRRNEIDCLVVIGGEGTFKGANKLADYGLKVICIPATIDNDIASTKMSIGFDTAKNTIVEAIDKIKDSSNSHNRCSIIEVMGRECGDLAYHSGIAVGAEAIYTNSEEFSYEDVSRIVARERDNFKRNILIVVTENICNVIELAEYVEKETNVDTRSTILGYIQRGGTPSALDRFIASGMGAYVAVLIKNEVFNVCIGTTGMLFYHTPIKQALAMEKEEDPYLEYLADALN